MAAVHVACPSGILLPLPTIPVNATASHQESEQGTNGGQLLEQLQVFNNRVDELLTLVSVQRQEAVRDLKHDISTLYGDATTCLQQCLLQAVSAKQPLLLTSAQHSSCFCRLLERLHLLDILVESVTGFLEDESGLQRLGQRQQVEYVFEVSSSFASQLEKQLQTVPGIDAVLASLVQHCQQIAAAGSKLSADLSSTPSDSKIKAEVIDVAALASIQEQHSALRALPLLLKLYYNNCSRSETLAAGKPEALSSKLLEKCLAQLAAKPVVPGYGSVPVCLPYGLESCQGLVEAAAARKLKLPTGFPADAKSLVKLDQGYSMQHKVLPLLQQHDMLCDLLSQLALEVRQSIAIDRDLNSQAFSNAEDLVIGCIDYVTAARNALLELDAWRLSQKQREQSQAAAELSRFALAQEDVVPFMNVLGAMKGITGLLIDSQDWLQQLLLVITVRQLQDFAANSLPGLAKLYPRNERIQQLVKVALLSMQGQVLDLKDDVCTSCTTSAVVSVPVTPTTEGMTGVEHPFRTAPGPIAEGLEGLKTGWGKGKQHVIEQQQDPTVEQTGLEQTAPEAPSTAFAAQTANASVVPVSSLVQTSQSAEQRLQTGEQWAEESSAGVVLEERDSSSAALQLPAGSDKRRWGKRLMRSIRTGRSKPKPSPHPELCAPPAALAALEEMLSGAEAEYQQQEAAAAETAGNSTPAVRGVRLQLSDLDEGSMLVNTDRNNPCSTESTLEAGNVAFFDDDVPGSVAAAAAVFERLAASHRCNGSPVRSHSTPTTATKVAAASEATMVPSAELPAPHQLVEVDDAADPNDRVPSRGPASVQSGTMSRVRAMLSLRRRQSASGLTSAVSAEIQQLADASDAPGSMIPANSAASGALRTDIADVSISRMGMADADQPAKPGRVTGIVSRMKSLRSQAKESLPSAGAGDGASLSKGFKALNLTAKFKKAIGERRQAGAAGADDLQSMHIDSPPPAACLVQLRVILEQLMHEIKNETKKRLMMQLQLAAAAAAGSAGTKPDASIARPLKQVKTMIKAVYRMQLALDYVRQLSIASDLSELWISEAFSSVLLADKRQQQHDGTSVAPAAAYTQADGACPASDTTKVLYNVLFESSHRCLSSNKGLSMDLTNEIEAGQCPQAPMGAVAAQESIRSWGCSESSFPAALIAGCMNQLQHITAELPLLAVHILWDAHSVLQNHQLPDGCLRLLKQQEEACLRCYMSGLVPQAYEHLKRVAAYHTVSQEALQTWGAPALLPVQPFYLDALLQEPCSIMLQGDYTAVAAAAESVLSRPGAVLVRGTEEVTGIKHKPLVEQTAAKQHQDSTPSRVALQQLLQQEQGDQSLQQQADRTTKYLEIDQQTEKQCLQSAPALKHVHSCSPKSLSTCREVRHRKRRSKAASKVAGIAEDVAAVASTQPALLTPLMQKVEQQQLAQQAELVRQESKVQQLATSKGACLVDVRDWLLAGLIVLLRKDAQGVVDICRHHDPTAVVEAHLQHSILQRTHELLSQYIPMPSSWQQLWSEADATTSDTPTGDDLQSASAHAVVDGLLRLMDTAVYDSEAQVFFRPAAAAAAAVGDSCGDGVLDWLSSALKPLRSFFGRQHLQYFLLWAGAGGQQHVLSSLLNKMETDQVAFLGQLQQLGEMLPPALQQLPPAQQCHDAGSVLQFYQQQLSQAVADPATCTSALGSLRRIGNCMALLHLLSMQQAVQATPVFMQAAPLLGIVGRPIQDAAAAAECFELEGLPPPPQCQATAAAFEMRSCAPGLLMPQIEQLEPTEAAQQSHDMQVQRELLQELAWQEEAEASGAAFDTSLLKPVGDLARHRIWQPSHFQQLMLGHDAVKVRGPALLLTQAAELRLWEATETQDYMAPCMERIQRWVRRLQQQLQGCDADIIQDDPASTSVYGGDTHSTSHTALGFVNPTDIEVQSGGKTVHRSVVQQQSEQVPGHQQVDLQDLHITETGRCCEGEVTAVAADVAGIGVHKNTLYQQQYASSPHKDVHHGDICEEEMQEQHHMEAEPEKIAAHTSILLCREGLASPPVTHKQQLAVCSEEALGTMSARQPALLGGSGCSSLLLSRVANGNSSVVSTLRLRNKPPSQLTQEDLEAAAEAAVIAASQPGSPQSGAVSNPWDAASAAAALLSAGTVAPAHAKLAYRALCDSSSPPQGGGLPADISADRLLGSGGGSGRCGLAELVDEALSSRTARSCSSESVRGRIVDCRQTQLQPPVESSEGGSIYHCDLAEDDATGEVDSAEGTDHRSLDISFSRQAACETAEGAAAASTAHVSPSRLVPKLGLEGIIPAHKRPQPLAKLPGALTHLMSAPVDASSHADCAGKSLTRGHAASSEAAIDDRCLFDSVEPILGSEVTNQRSSYPEDELLDGTCAELMRVKMERDTYKSEVEVLKNQLRNQDQTIALLSGNFHTPRTTDAGNAPSNCGSPDREGSSMQRQGDPTPGNTSSDRAQPEVKGGTITVSEADSAAAGRNEAAAVKDIPKVSSEQLLEELSELKPETSKLSTRVQQPSVNEWASDMQVIHDYDEDSSSAAESDSDEGSTMSRPAIRKLQLPQPVHNRSRSASASGSGIGAAQLAVALSALKFALLLDIAMGSATNSGVDCAASETGAGAVDALSAMLQSSQLKRIRKVSVAKAGILAVGAGDSAAAEQSVKVLDIQGAAEAAIEGSDGSHSSDHRQLQAGLAARFSTAPQHLGGSWQTAGGQYGDGPLLASAVLLQLSGQVRKHALLDAVNRIAHWVEYDAVKQQGGMDRNDAEGKGIVAGPSAAGGINPTSADGIAPPKPSSKKRKEEQAELEARQKQQAAAQQILLQQIAAAARQADKVYQDGSSIATRFAPPVPSHTQRVKLQVFRPDVPALLATSAAAARSGAYSREVPASAAAAGEAAKRSVRFSNADNKAHLSSASGAGSMLRGRAVHGVPVRGQILEFQPAVQPWADLIPCNIPIQEHPLLPMPRPKPLLLPTGIPSAVAQPDVAAAAGCALPHAAGQLVAGAGVTPGAGLVAAARAVHAREALLSTMPRAAMYSYSVKSDHNRSGRPDDGYSKAPSSVGWDSMEESSPQKQRNLAAAAAVGAGAVRLGGRRPGGTAHGLAESTAETRIDGWSQGVYSGSETSSPNKSPTRSPTRRAAAALTQLLTQ